MFQYGKLKDVKSFSSYFDNYFLVKIFQRKSFVKKLSWPHKVKDANEVKTIVIKFFRIWEVNFNIFVSADFWMLPKKVYNFHNEFYQKYLWINPGASPAHL